MNQLWQMWVGGLTPQAVQRIINRAELYPIEEAKLGFEGDQKEKKSFILYWIWAYILLSTT